jgi:hypothetical protein
MWEGGGTSLDCAQHVFYKLLVEQQKTFVDNIVKNVKYDDKQL